MMTKLHVITLGFIIVKKEKKDEILPNLHELIFVMGGIKYDMDDKLLCVN